MNIHEFQAKQLFAQFGVPVPPGNVAATAEEAKATALRLFADGHKALFEFLFRFFYFRIKFRHLSSSLFSL